MRRVARLFPALFFTLLVSTAVAAALFPPDRLRDYGASLAAASLSVANVWFWSQSGYFDTASITKPLLHTWSLAIEEQFYLVWPVLLLAIARSRVRSVVFLSVAFCLSLGWNVDLVYGGSAMTQGVSAALRDAFTDYRAAIYFLLPFRVFEFVIGAGLVWVATKPGRGTASAITAAGIGLVAIPIVAYTERTVFPSVAALAPCIGAAALIYAGASTPLGRLFDNRLVVPVGSISYSLYLIHWPAIVFYRYWKDAPRLSTLDQAGILVFCIVGAALMYKFVEQPFRRPDTGTSWLPRRRLAPLAVACTAGLVVIGTSAYTSAGWWWRYPPEIRTLLETDVFYYGLGAMRHACFMGPNNIYKDIPPGCYEIAKDTPKKSIIFFGDSTAYHLMEGFQAVLGEEYEIYAFVSASCAPVIGYSEPENPRNCIFNNDAFLHNIIDRNHYDLVIISANIRFDERIKGMPEVRHIFEERGIPYVLLGQMPYFKAKPADTIARYGKVAGLDDAVRASLVFPCDQNEYGLDQTVPPNAFFSMKALLCRDGYPVYEIGGRLIHSDHIHFHQYGKLEVSKRIVAWLSQHGYVGERWAEVDQNHSALAK